MSKKLSKITITSRVTWFLMGVFFLVTLVSQLVVRFHTPLKTEAALYYEHTESVLFKGVYIRDERQISHKTDGIVAYTNKDGSKLAINSVIAKIYSSKEEIFVQQKILELETQIKALSDAEVFAGTDSSQLEAFSGQLSDKHLQILKSIDEGDYEKAAKYKSDYLSLQGKINVVQGVSSGYSEKIKELENEIDGLKSAVVNLPQDLRISESGYFISSADGYEDILTYDSASTLSKEQIEDIIKNPVLDVSPDVLGKVVDSYKWRMAAVVETDKTRGLHKGAFANLVIGSSSGAIEMEVISSDELDDGTTVYVFECDLLTDEFVKKRTANVRLLLDDYSGIRIPQDAVRFVEQERGVYILSGSVVEFKKIDIKYTAEDYIIVENREEQGYLSLYDNVIVSGKDLYDGKIVS